MCLCFVWCWFCRVLYISMDGISKWLPFYTHRHYKAHFIVFNLSTLPRIVSIKKKYTEKEKLKQFCCSTQSTTHRAAHFKTSFCALYNSCPNGEQKRNKYENNQLNIWSTQHCHQVSTSDNNGPCTWRFTIYNGKWALRSNKIKKKEKIKTPWAGKQKIETGE